MKRPVPLEAGTKLGPYEVKASIGAGGMGEVYRARDTKLNRDVALKVLPEAFVNEPDRLARFQREAHGDDYGDGGVHVAGASARQNLSTVGPTSGRSVS